MSRLVVTPAEMKEREGLLGRLIPRVGMGMIRWEVICLISPVLELQRVARVGLKVVARLGCRVVLLLVRGMREVGLGRRRRGEQGRARREGSLGLRVGMML